MFTPDITALADSARAALCKRAGVKSAVCFPILIDGQIAGCMDFFSQETLTLSEERLDALRKVGKLVSAAMQRVRIQELQAEQAANIQAVNEVLEVMGQAKDIESAARAALETVCKAFGWVYGSYFAIDSAVNAMAFSLDSGTIHEDFRQATRSARFQEGEGLSGRAWKTRDLIFTPDMGAVSDFARAGVAKRTGVKSGNLLSHSGEWSGRRRDGLLLARGPYPSEQRMTALRKVAALVSPEWSGSKRSGATGNWGEIESRFYVRR